MLCVCGECVRVRSMCARARVACVCVCVRECECVSVRAHVLPMQPLVYEAGHTHNREHTHNPQSRPQVYDAASSV